MTGFEEVEKLKELEQKARPAPWKIFNQCIGDCIVDGENMWIAPNTQLLIDLRNAAPLLLDIASQIQPGDDKLLAQLVYEQEDLARFMTGFGGVRQSERVMIDLLKRYQKMAERMEEQ